MGRWKDADGYWVDEDHDDHEPKRTRKRGCACAPNGDWPGYCPGQDNCPLCAKDEPEPDEDPA